LRITKKPKDSGACFYAEFKKNRYLGDDSLKRRIFSLQSKKGWLIQSDEDDSLNQVAEAVKSNNFVTQKELGEHFGHQKAWANKKIKQCVLEDKLTKGEWLSSVEKAKEKRQLDQMSEEELRKLKV
jgi:hypothetical protein